MWFWTRGWSLLLAILQALVTLLVQMVSREWNYIYILLRGSMYASFSGLKNCTDEPFEFSNLTAQIWSVNPVTLPIFSHADPSTMTTSPLTIGFHGLRNLVLIYICLKCLCLLILTRSSPGLGINLCLMRGKVLTLLPSYSSPVSDILKSMHIFSNTDYMSAVSSQQLSDQKVWAYKCEHT